MTVSGNSIFLNLRLESGTHSGVVRISRPGSAAIAFKFPRSMYSQAKSLLKELDKACTYLLLRSDEEVDQSGLVIVYPRIYIGKADNGRDRLDTHNTNKDFWSHVIVLTTTDDDYFGDEAKWIESELMRIGTQHRRAKFENQANSRLPRFNDHRADYVHRILRDFLLFLPALGVLAFEPQSAGSSNAPAVSTPPSAPIELQTFAPDPPLPTPRPMLPTATAAPVPSATTAPLSIFLRSRTGHYEARGVFTPPSTVMVLEGSKGPLRITPSASPFVHEKRKVLLTTGDIAVEGDSIIFARNCTFDTPSAAASAVTGGNENGWRVWKAANGGTLDEASNRRGN